MQQSFSFSKMWEKITNCLKDKSGLKIKIIKADQQTHKNVFVSHTFYRISMFGCRS